MSGLSVVAVNHCHPQMPHVCALRLRAFSEALAARGNRVVLLVAGSEGLAASPPPEIVTRELAAHDWSVPFVLAVAPAPMPTLARAREGEMPALLGRAVLAAHFAFRGGPFTDWVAASRPYWPVLARDFTPHITWATFGNTGAWIIARGIAAAAGCPWAMDFKDNWESFIPPAFRGFLASRFAGAAAATALSKAHADEAERWFGRRPEVVYSGFPAAALADDGAPPDDGTIRLTLVGSFYDEAYLARLLDGVAGWIRGARPPAAGVGVVLSYYGVETEAFRAVAGFRLGGLCEIEVAGFRPFDELLAAMRRARANLFIRSARGYFHHKVFEMLAAGRPIVCLPDEVEEAKAIVRGVGGTLYGCTSPAEVAAALERIVGEAGARPTVSREALARFTWEAEAAHLERVLRQASADRP